ncbi:MAG: NAD(P)-dependent oxidoreductase [Nitrososphaeria archaeon]
MATIVTGGSGLVGSHVVEELVREGKEDKIIIYDVLPPRKPEVVAQLGKKVVYVDGNILDVGRLVETTKNHCVKGIIHTTGIINYKYIIANPTYSVMVNFNGTLNVLELARLYDLKIVFTSSGSVYGKVDEFAKEDFPLRPGDIYGATKAMCEMLGEQYASTYGIDYVSTRLYFIYGPGLSLAAKSIEDVFTPPVQPLSVLLLMVQKGIKKEKLFIESGGDTRLDYTYVKDSAHGVVLAYHTKKPPHRAYNISTGKAYSLSEVAAAINKYVGQECIIIGSGTVKGWPPRPKYLDISLAKTELGYVPLYGLERGINEFCEHASKSLQP